MREGLQVRIMRVARGMIQRELAMQAKIHASRLSEFEKGYIGLEEDKLTRIREALRWPERAAEAFAILDDDEEYGEVDRD